MVAVIQAFFLPFKKVTGFLKEACLLCTLVLYSLQCHRNNFLLRPQNQKSGRKNILNVKAEGSLNNTLALNCGDVIIFQLQVNIFCNLLFRTHLALL